MRAWRRLRWDLERFGATPAKLAARFGRSSALPSLAISLPKAGTHLLERALCLRRELYRPLVPTLNDAALPERGGLETVLGKVRAGQVFVGHLGHARERAQLLGRLGVRVFFLVRDPRDIAVSQAFYIVRRRDHPLHRRFAALPDLEARVRLAIEGDRDLGLPPMADRLDAYAGWLDEDAALVVRFETLIGAGTAGAGNGDAHAARDRALDAIYRHLGLATGEAERAALAAGIVSDASPTFRRGRAGGWRHHFRDTDLAALFVERAGAQLERYGYDDGAET